MKHEAYKGVRLRLALAEKTYRGSGQSHGGKATLLTWGKS